MAARIVPALLCAFMCIGAPTTVHAQDTTSTANLAPTPEGRVAQVVLRDGSALVGRVLAVTATTIRFASAIGESIIDRAVVASIRLVDQSSMHAGEHWPEDPSQTRLFFAPTGRMLRARETYFADAYIFFPSIQVGISDQFTFGGGMSLFPLLGLDEQIYYLTPKMGVYASPKLNIAVGVLAAGARALSDATPAGIAYGVATFGDENNSFTAGSGVGFTRGRASSTAVLMLGGSTRVSRGVALITENYFAGGSSTGMVLSGGLRFLSEHIAVDLAALGGSGSTVVPYVAFIYRW